MRQILIKDTGIIKEISSDRIKVYCDWEESCCITDVGVEFVVPFELEFLNPLDKQNVGFAPSLPYSLASQGVIFHGATIDSDKLIRIALSTKTGTKIQVKKGDVLVILNLFERLSIRKITAKSNNGIIQLDEEQK